MEFPFLNAKKLSFIMYLLQQRMCVIVHDLVELLPESESARFDGFRETSSYQPEMMLNIILYSCAQSVYSRRRIKAALSDIRRRGLLIESKSKKTMKMFFKFLSSFLWFRTINILNSRSLMFLH